MSLVSKQHRIAVHFCGNDNRTRQWNALRKVIDLNEIFIAKEKQLLRINLEKLSIKIASNNIVISNLSNKTKSNLPILWAKREHSSIERKNFRQCCASKRKFLRADMTKRQWKQILWDQTYPLTRQKLHLHKWIGHVIVCIRPENWWKVASSLGGQHVSTDSICWAIRKRKGIMISKN